MFCVKIDNCGFISQLYFHSIETATRFSKDILIDNINSHVYQSDIDHDDTDLKNTNISLKDLQIILNVINAYKNNKVYFDIQIDKIEFEDEDDN